MTARNDLGIDMPAGFDLPTPPGCRQQGRNFLDRPLVTFRQARSQRELEELMGREEAPIDLQLAIRAIAAELATTISQIKERISPRVARANTIGNVDRSITLEYVRSFQAALGNMSSPEVLRQLQEATTKLWFTSLDSQDNSFSVAGAVTYIVNAIRFIQFTQPTGDNTVPDLGAAAAAAALSPELAPDPPLTEIESQLFLSINSSLRALLKSDPPLACNLALISFHLRAAESEPDQATVEQDEIRVTIVRTLVKSFARQIMLEPLLTHLSQLDQTQGESDVMYGIAHGLDDVRREFERAISEQQTDIPPRYIGLTQYLSALQSILTCTQPQNASIPSIRQDVMSMIEQFQERLLEFLPAHPPTI